MANTAFAPAKVNLTLHVTGQRSDGYHLLDSLVAFADVGDHVTVTRAPALSLTVRGPQSADVPTDASNLVVKAAEAMGVADVAITLDKHLPSAAGIGGGSSDAAATMRAISLETGIPVPDDQGLSIGADVPVCLLARSARMQGIGETLAPVDLPKDLWAVLINPGFSVATGKIFQALASKNNPPMPDPLPALTSPDDFMSFLNEQRNDLEPAALAVEPRIGAVLQALRRTDSAVARMSGSGATCFGLFTSKEAAISAHTALAKAHPAWWVVPTELKANP